MTAPLKKATKGQLEKLLTEPPFPSFSAAAKTLGLNPYSVYHQGDIDPEWYASVKALREERQMEWLSQQQADAVAALHDMTADALLVKTEHLKPYFTLRLPAVAAKASDYVLDHVIGKATERHEHSGPHGGPIETASTHDYSGFTSDELKDISARLMGGGHTGGTGAA